MPTTMRSRDSQYQLGEVLFLLPGRVVGVQQMEYDRYSSGSLRWSYAS
jgi:hypothetical protein